MFDESEQIEYIVVLLRSSVPMKLRQTPQEINSVLQHDTSAKVSVAKVSVVVYDIPDVFLHITPESMKLLSDSAETIAI